MFCVCVPGLALASLRDGLTDENYEGEEGSQKFFSPSARRLSTSCCLSGLYPSASGATPIPPSEVELVLLSSPSTRLVYYGQAARRRLCEAQFNHPSPPLFSHFLSNNEISCLWPF